MPYRYLDDIATADVAFEATGATLPELFSAAADATTNVMVRTLSRVEPRERRAIAVADDAPDMLLFQLLQELIYLKDAEQLLLRVPTVSIRRDGESWVCEAEAVGEVLDPERHDLAVDVKAVTLHMFGVTETEEGWKALVILDI